MNPCVAKQEFLRYTDKKARKEMNHYADMVNGVRKRKRASQMKFYDLFIRQVFQSAYAVTGNPGEAEEIAQDTMLKVFSDTRLIDDDVPGMIRLLRRMAVNRAIDTVRRRKNFILSLEDEPWDGCEDDGEAEEAETWDTDNVRDGIDRLPPVYRSVLALRLFEEMNFADIAVQLNVNASTVRVQYTRGIARLRKCLIQKKEDSGK